MPFVSLFTDFGDHDTYLGQLKGAILQENESIRFIDMTHAIKPHDIATAGWLLRNSFEDCPKGTIHIVSVLNNYNNASSYILFQQDGHFFVGPNNGVFSLAFDKLPQEIYEVIDERNGAFTLKQVISKIVGQLSHGVSPDQIGMPVRNLIMRIQLQPVINRYMIRGSVIYIDHYENVIINITKEQFEKARAGREFTIYMKRNDPIHEIHLSYQDVPVGEMLCLFNAHGFMEIAIHGGQASSMLSLGLDEMVQIDFHE